MSPAHGLQAPGQTGLRCELLSALKPAKCHFPTPHFQFGPLLVGPGVQLGTGVRHSTVCSNQDLCSKTRIYWISGILSVCTPDLTVFLLVVPRAGTGMQGVDIELPEVKLFVVCRGKGREKLQNPGARARGVWLTCCP